MKAHEFADVFPMLSDAELTELADDIKAHGLRHPILTFEEKILDGRNRFAACKLAKVEPEFTAFNGSPEAALARVVSENLVRRHLDFSQRSMVGARIATLKQGARTDLAPIGAKSQADAATLMNVSRRSVQRASAVIEKGTEELKAAVDSGVLSVSVAAEIATLPKDEQKKVVKQAKAEVVGVAKAVKAQRQEEKKTAKAEVAKRITESSLAFPDGPFRVLVVDPPWKYDARADDDSHRARNPYPDMTVEEIKRLPVANLAHADSVLWLWTTNAFLRDAFDIANAWGFTPKTVLTWDKELIGLGDWLRNVTEHCLMCVRGRPTVILTNQTTLIRERRREHSRKPEAFYAMAEKLCPGNRVELFARAGRDGWAKWGAESEKFDAA